MNLYVELGHTVKVKRWAVSCCTSSVFKEAQNNIFMYLLGLIQIPVAARSKA
jgi:hypothetical protein